MFVPCNNCEDIFKGYNGPSINEYDVFKRLRALTLQGDIELLAGSCPLSDFERHMDKEDLYIIEYYFKCQCGLIYYVGFCVRGKPVARILIELPDHVKNNTSGRYGRFSR